VLLQDGHRIEAADDNDAGPVDPTGTSRRGLFGLPMSKIPRMPRLQSTGESFSPCPDIPRGSPEAGEYPAAAAGLAFGDRGILLLMNTFERIEGTIRHYADQG